MRSISSLFRDKFSAKPSVNLTHKGKLTVYFVLRAFTMIISFVSFPVILNNIGSNSFAEVSVLLTLFQFITILDWGLGNFIISRFTPIFQSNKIDGKSEFSSKFLPLLPISTALLVVLVFFVDRLSLVKLAFSLGDGSDYQFRIFLFYILSFINIILLCLTKMLLVLDRRDRFQLTLSLNIVVPQIVLLVASFSTLSSIDLVLLYQVSSGLVYLFGLGETIKGNYSSQSVSINLKSCHRLNTRYLVFLINSSYRFFALQLIGFITSQAGVLLVAQFYNSRDVTEYSIIMRILGVHIAFVTFIFGSSQAEINRIMTAKNSKDLKDFFLSVYAFSIIFITLIYTLFFIFRENSFFLKLVGGTVFSPKLVIASLLFIIVWSINFPFSVVAISDFPSNWYFRGAVISLPVNLVIAVVLLKYLNFKGGPLVANSVSMVVFSIAPFIFWFSRENRHSKLSLENS